MSDKGVRDRPLHHGWAGTPGKSDFHAAWGRIPLSEIGDYTQEQSHSVARQRAVESGFAYFLSPKTSKAGDCLYKVYGAAARCVHAVLQYQQTNASANRRRYRGSIEEKIRQLVRVAKNRAEDQGSAFDLDPNDIIRRVRLGLCEATGLPLDLDPENMRGSFSPSLDQIAPGGGYTQDNVQVVCWAYNRMKSDFEPDLLRSLVLALAQQWGWHVDTSTTQRRFSHKIAPSSKGLENQ